MTKERLSLGKKGEDFAAIYLKKMGYKIKERNYRSPLGEIDIIATDRKTLVFIEVKTRGSMRFGAPFEAVNKKKQEQIAKTAEYYLSKNNIVEQPARIDIVSIMSDGDKMEAELIQNAFDVPA